MITQALNIEVNIDWALLRDQKLALLDLVWEGGHDLSSSTIASIEGVISMIDDIQDQAAAHLGDDVVFETTPEDDFFDDFRFMGSTL